VRCGPGWWSSESKGWFECLESARVLYAGVDYGSYRSDFILRKADSSHFSPPNWIATSLW
jgi:hypothetical protein